MSTYVINENVSEEELTALRNASGSAANIERWPTIDSSLPDNVDAAILIVRVDSTALEETRTLLLINSAIRIVCVFLQDLDAISELAEKYCSAKVAIGGGGLATALHGSDEVQQDAQGKPAPQNPQKPHNC